MNGKYKRAMGRMGLGLFAAMAVSAFVPLKYPPATMVWVRAESPLGQTPSAWPTIHRAFTNNSAFLDKNSPPGPNYLMQLPTMASSDTPVVNHELFVNVSGGGRNPRAIYPGMTMAIRPENGQVLWQHLLPNALNSEPIVAEGRVYVGEGNAVFRSHLAFPLPTIEPTTVRGTGPSAIVAFSAVSGQELWRYPTVGSDQPSPTYADGKLYVVNGSRQLIVLNAVTGRRLWHLNIGVYVSRSSPRIVGHMLYVGGGGPDAVVAVNLIQRRVVWKKFIVGAIGAVDDTPLAYAGGELYGEAMLGSPYLPLENLKHHQMLFAIDAKTGRLLWRRDIAYGFEPRYKQGSTPMIHGNELFVGNAITGEFFAFNRVSGKPLWAVKFPDPITRPTTWIDGDIVGMTTHGLLFAMTAEGGLLRSIRIDPWVNGFGPILIDHTLFVTGNKAHEGFLAALPLSQLLPYLSQKSPG
ncbi:MAG: PQQ-like beta-propeller repeat protein [Firmicutes bacterium]|nr:PQQ-like beta-propeller repeat protein [Bacillota bacterium]MCL5063976.1 PQQ-like beta-propeller repeat protein [Bacillota bacterium]